MAESRTLDLTLVSARDLRDVNLVSKMEVYAVVYLAGDPVSQQRVATDRAGGRCPAWNATVRLVVPASGAGSGAVRVLLRTERALGADRDVGEVLLPLPDILAGAGDAPTVGAYKVRKVGSTKAHGVLNLSYKLGVVTQYPAGAAVKAGEPVAAGYLAAAAAPYAAAPPPQHSYPYPCPPPTMVRPSHQQPLKSARRRNKIKAGTSSKYSMLIIVTVCHKTPLINKGFIPRTIFFYMCTKPIVA